MRYAIFGDIHSNLEAYESVLAAFEDEKPDEYYCVGDIVGYGANPVECINKTKRLNPQIVAGNHDWGAVGLTDIDCFNQNAKDAIVWTRTQLLQEDKEYLKALKILCKRKFTIVHGSLNKPEEFEYIFGLNTAYKTFLAMGPESVCFVGHSHVPGIFIEDSGGNVDYNSWPQVRWENGKRYIINVGSVGQPRDNDPRAAYCIYDTTDRTINIKRTRYDIAKAKEKIIKAGLPRILAERLSLGK